MFQLTSFDVSGNEVIMLVHDDISYLMNLCEQLQDFSEMHGMSVNYSVSRVF